MYSTHYSLYIYFVPLVSSLQEKYAAKHSVNLDHERLRKIERETPSRFSNDKGIKSIGSRPKYLVTTRMYREQLLQRDNIHLHNRLMSIRQRPSEYAFLEHQYYADRPTTPCHKVPLKPTVGGRPSTAPVYSRPERPPDTPHHRSIYASALPNGSPSSSLAPKQSIRVDHGSPSRSHATSPSAVDDCAATTAHGPRHPHPHRHHYVASAAFTRSRMINEAHAANAHVVRRIEAARPHYPRTASPWRAQPWPRTRSRTAHRTHRHATDSSTSPLAVRASTAPLKAAAQHAPARPPAPPLALPAEVAAEALQLTARAAHAGGGPYAAAVARTQAAARTHAPHDVAPRARRPPSRASTPAASVYLHACGREAQLRARMAVRGMRDPNMERLARTNRRMRTPRTEAGDTHTQAVAAAVDTAGHETLGGHKSTSWTEEEGEDEREGEGDEDVEDEQEEDEGGEEDKEDAEEEREEDGDDRGPEDATAEAKEEAGKAEDPKIAPSSAPSPHAHTHNKTSTSTVANVTPRAATRAARPHRPTECPLTPYLHARQPATRTAHTRTQPSVTQHARGWSGRPLAAPEDYVHTHARAARHELPQDSRAASLSTAPHTSYVDTDAAARAFRALLRDTRMFGGPTPRSNPYVDDADAEEGASGDDAGADSWQAAWRRVRSNSLRSSGNTGPAHGSGEGAGSSARPTSPAHVPATQQASRATHVRANIAGVQANASRGRGSVSLAQAVQRAAAASRQQRTRHVAEAAKQRRARNSSAPSAPAEVRLPTDRYFARERARRAVTSRADQAPPPPHPAHTEASAGSTTSRVRSPHSAVPPPYRAAVAHEARRQRNPARGHALSTTLSAYYRQLSTAQLQLLANKYREHLRRIHIRTRNDERRRVMAQRNALAAKYRAEEERRRRRAGLPPLSARDGDGDGEERGVLSDNDDGGEAGGADDIPLNSSASAGADAREHASGTPTHEHPRAQLPSRTRLEDIRRAEAPLETVVLMLARAEVDAEVDQLMRSRTTAGGRNAAAGSTRVSTSVYRYV